MRVDVEGVVDAAFKAIEETHRAGREAAYLMVSPATLADLQRLASIARPESRVAGALSRAPGRVYLWGCEVTPLSMADGRVLVMSQPAAHSDPEEPAMPEHESATEGGA